MDLIKTPYQLWQFSISKLGTSLQLRDRILKARLRYSVRYVQSVENLLNHHQIFSENPYDYTIGWVLICSDVRVLISRVLPLLQVFLGLGFNSIVHRENVLCFGLFTRWNSSFGFWSCLQLTPIVCAIFKIGCGLSYSYFITTRCFDKNFSSTTRVVREWKYPRGWGLGLIYEGLLFFL